MNLLKSLFVVLLFVTFSACEIDEDKLVAPVDLALQVNFSESYGQSGAAGVEVTLTNTTSGQQYKTTSDAQGQVNFTGLPSGRYDIIAQITFSREEFYEFAGIYPNGDEITFNASASGIAINLDSQVPALVLQAGATGGLVFKQIYYAGSDTRDGALYRDQFIEIYNNSDSLIYLDGLYIMGVYDNNGNAGEYLDEDGSYDWQQAIGMPASVKANADYFYSRWLYQIPGSGSDHPLAAGEGVVIAQNALNHKAPYTNGEGETVAIGDPSLTVDLSQADFEVYLGDQVDRPLKTDLDNPDVPNLAAVHIWGRDWVLDTRGRDSYIIFRSSDPIADFPRYPSPDEREVSATTTMHIQVPRSLVLDAVEMQPAPTDQIPKKLSADTDAGYSYVPGGSYSSQSAIRKTSRTFSGRVILQDSNNSTEDFTFLEKSEPGAFTD